MPVEDPEELAAVLAGPIRSARRAGISCPSSGTGDTRTLDVTLRSNVTFTPTLSLQLYAQLFAAKGRYGRYRILTSPSEEAPYAAYPKRHDFALNAFNTNLVFRGSTAPARRFPGVVAGAPRRLRRRVPGGGALSLRVLHD